jgi:Zn-dependent membrane protease YugP
MRSPAMMMAGIVLFSLAVIFTIVTLPVEWNASSRAKKAMVTAGIVSEQERQGASEVLNAAFLTYVAAAVTAIMTLLYYLLRSGFLGGGDD